MALEAPDGLSAGRTRDSLVVLVLVGLAAGIWVLGNRATPAIEVVAGSRLDKGAITAQFRTNPSTLFTISAAGDWCVTGLPVTADLDSPAPVSSADLATSAPLLRCTAPPPDSNREGVALGNVEVSPAGTKVFAVGQDVESQGLTLFVMDTESLAVESYDYAITRDRPAWVNEEEILYYEADAWSWATPGGSVLLRVPGPAPGDGTYRVNETTYAYRTAGEDTTLIKLDLAAAATTEIGPLPDLASAGPRDPGIVMAVTPDFSHTVLWSAARTNLGLPGTSVFVYDVDRRRLLSHSPPGSSEQTQTALPFLVGPDHLAYSAAVVAPGSLRAPSVYVAPLDNPNAAVEVFTGGFVMVYGSFDGLIIDDLDAFAFLELNS